MFLATFRPFLDVFLGTFFQDVTGRVFSWIWTPFGSLLADFSSLLKVSEVLLDGTHSAAKTYILPFASPSWAFIRVLFEEWISGCVFCRFYVVFCDFGSHLACLWALFGSFVLDNFQILSG